MAPAVANPLYMGYRALYKTVLESSKRGIAKAMRVFADKDNYPVLLHCIHGERAEWSATMAGYLVVTLHACLGNVCQPESTECFPNVRL